MEDDSRTGGDASSFAVRPQAFTSDGSKAGSGFLVNTKAAYDQRDPTILSTRLRRQPSSRRPYTVSFSISSSVPSPNSAVEPLATTRPASILTYWSHSRIDDR